jgi:hypothetical protein
MRRVSAKSKTSGKETHPIRRRHDDNLQRAEIDSVERLDAFDGIDAQLATRLTERADVALDVVRGHSIELDVPRLVQIHGVDEAAAELPIKHQIAFPLNCIKDARAP